MQIKSQRAYNVLIVDDKPENLYTLERLLRKIDGVQVFAAASGNEALAYTLEHDFCVAIVDVQMPDMDGYELVELIRGNKTTAQMPIIFVSAIFSDEYHHRKGYDVGAVDFLSKPFVPEILLSKVRVFIDLYEQRALLEEWNLLMERMVEQRTEELTRAYERLEKLDKAKTDFIQITAHELRTPLTLISGYAGVLADMFREDGRALSMAQGILNGHDRLLEVINSMLDVTRIDTQALNLHKVPLSLHDKITTLVSSLQEALKERSITLHLEGLDTLPRVKADAELINKLFYQLLVNAIKYTPDGGRVTVSGAVADSAGEVEVRVIDTGIGINPEYQELIFEKFFQTGQVKYHSSGKTKFKGGGPGLGLAIARGVVQAHGGKIWAESAGCDETNCPGSTIHVRLPVG